jgi:hypothetical protein
MERRMLLLVLASTLGAAGLVSSADAARTKCRVVNAGSGTSYRTPQEAVDAASPGDTLRVRGTCVGDTRVTKSLTIAGERRHATTLDGGNDAQHPGSVLTVAGGLGLPQVNVTVSDLTITGGYLPTEPGAGLGFGGGGISNGTEDNLTLNDTTVIGNHAPSGGGIWNGLALIVLNHSTVTGNTAQNGGGIATGFGALRLVDSSVSRNHAVRAGGGVFDQEGGVAVTDSVLSRNSADEAGGGLYNDGSFVVSGGSVVARNTTAGNGGGVYNESALTLSDGASVIKNKAALRGGGIYEDEGAGAAISYSSGWSGSVSGNLPDDVFP